MSAAWCAPVTLRGQRLVLTPLRLADAPDLVRALGTAAEAAEVTAHLSYRSPDLPGARRVVTRALSTPDQQPFATRLAGSGELVGTTSYYDIDADRRSLAIGHTWLAAVLAHRAEHRGQAAAAGARVRRPRCRAGGVAHRHPQRRFQAAIERLGATREGVLRRHRRRPDGSWRDTVQYAMVAPEWPAARERLTARLATG